MTFYEVIKVECMSKRATRMMGWCDSSGRSSFHGISEKVILAIHITTV